MRLTVTMCLLLLLLLLVVVVCRVLTVNNAKLLLLYVHRAAWPCAAPHSVNSATHHKAARICLFVLQRFDKAVARALAVQRGLVVADRQTGSPTQ